MRKNFRRDGNEKSCNYNDFETIFDLNLYIFPINELLIHQYYTQHENLNYTKICNVFEEVLKDDSYVLPAIKNSFRKSLKKVIKRKFVYNRLVDFCAKSLKNRFKLFQKIYNHLYVNEYTNQMQKRNYASEEEINFIINKIKNCFKYK